MIKTLLSLSLVALPLTMFSEANAYPTPYVCTQSTPLNVRSLPSVNSRVIGSIPRGASVIIEGDQNGYTWAYHFPTGTSGWVSLKYICWR